MKWPTTCFLLVTIGVIHQSRRANTAAVDQVTTAQQGLVNDVGTLTANTSAQSPTTDATTNTSTFSASSPSSSPSILPSLHPSLVPTLDTMTSASAITQSPYLQSGSISPYSAASGGAASVSVQQQQPSSLSSAYLASAAGGSTLQSLLLSSLLPASVPSTVQVAAISNGPMLLPSPNPMLTLASGSTSGPAGGSTLLQQLGSLAALPGASPSSVPFAYSSSISISTAATSTSELSARSLHFTPVPSTSTSSAPSSTSIPAKTTASSSHPLCSPVWSNTTNVSSLRSVRYLWFTSASACLDACSSGAIPNCIAVDVDNTNPSFVACLAHVNVSDLDVNFNTSGTTQYRLISGCPHQTVTCANSTWVALNQTQSVGAVSYTQYTTLADCQSACLTVVPNCVAVDFASGSQCWLYTDPSELLTTFSSSEVTQYRIVSRCSGQGVCSPVWTSQWYTSSPGAVQRPDVQTVSGCQALCVATSGCVAIDYSNTMSCWLHLSQSNLRTTIAQGDVTQYRLVSVCP